MNIISQHTNEKKNNLTFDKVVFKFKEYAQELTKASIVEFIEKLDNNFFKAKVWKNYYHNHGFKERTLITSLGIIKFKRRYYIAKDRKTHKNFCFVDDALKIEKYSRLSIDAIKELTAVATEVNASYAAKAALTDVVVSRQTVSNILKSMNIINNDQSIINEIIESCGEEKSTIYIELDEAHCNLQEKNKRGNRKKNIIANLALVHTGHSSLTYASKRKELENKHYFGEIKADTSAFCDKIYDYILKRFKTSSIKQIFVSGDGARWINSFTRNLQYCFREFNIKVIQVLDKFHTRKRLTTIFSSNKKFINYFFSNLNTFTVKDFKTLAYGFYQNGDKHKCTLPIFASHVNYICNNFEYIKNQLHPEYKTSCSMEGHVSHILASRLTSRPKGFSYPTLQTLVQLRVLKANLHELTAQDIINFRKPITPEVKIRSKVASKMYKKFYDFNIELSIKNSTNTKMKDYINKIASPKWFYY